MMKNNDPKITIENNIVFLTLDLKGMDLYHRGKAIRKFVNSDTKILEDYVDDLIKAIFQRNGIIVNSTNKSALNEAFDSLKAKGKDIKITNFYGGRNVWNCKYVDTKNEITILLEDNRFLISGIEVSEVKI